MAVDGDKLVNLYYLGGLDGKSKAGRVTADGRAFALPLAGENFEVSRRVADQLMAKHKYRLRNGDYVSAFTLDARVAKRIKDGFSVQDAQTLASSISSVSVETLLAELKARGIKVPDEEVPEKEAPKVTAKTATKAKPKSKPKVREAQDDSEDLLGGDGLFDPLDEGE